MSGTCLWWQRIMHHCRLGVSSEELWKSFTWQKIMAAQNPDPPEDAANNDSLASIASCKRSVSPWVIKRAAIPGEPGFSPSVPELIG